MRVLVTGANGFIGKNLCKHLEENGLEVIKFTRKNKVSDLIRFVKDVDFIFHLAGVNRPKNSNDFISDNVEFTKQLCALIEEKQKPIPIAFTSSTQVEYVNDYGKSKIEAEKILTNLLKKKSNPVFIFRLPSVFGKWGRPDYNSVVATFCTNISRNKPVKVIDPKNILELVYIDDLMKTFMDLIKLKNIKSGFKKVEPIHKISVGDLLKHLENFKNLRKKFIIEDLNDQLVRALYSTYLSYLPPENFCYPVPSHSDPRGVFVEMLKTKGSGQISFFTAFPGMTRGGHYHHSKTEKFLVVHGQARFQFMNLNSGERHTIFSSDKEFKIVETVPGWAHDMSNIGEEILICLVWANEIFDSNNSDTIPYPISNINEKIQG